LKPVLKNGHTRKIARKETNCRIKLQKEISHLILPAIMQLLFEFKEI
jgi:hypothetical protein